MSFLKPATISGKDYCDFADFPVEIRMDVAHRRVGNGGGLKNVGLGVVYRKDDGKGPNPPYKLSCR